MPKTCLRAEAFCDGENGSNAATSLRIHRTFTSLPSSHQSRLRAQPTPTRSTPTWPWVRHMHNICLLPTTSPPLLASVLVSPGSSESTLSLGHLAGWPKCRDDASAVLPQFQSWEWLLQFRRTGLPASVLQRGDGAVVLLKLLKQLAFAYSSPGHGQTQVSYPQGSTQAYGPTGRVAISSLSPIAGDAVGDPYGRTSPAQLGSFVQYNNSGPVGSSGAYIRHPAYSG